MAAICLIYAVGNVPQMLVMVVQNEALESRYDFQVFRQIANTLEVLNHCLNFFIFCMASSEYTRAFLLTNCRCVRPWLMRFPMCAAFIHARRLNSAFDIRYGMHLHGGTGTAIVDLPSNFHSEAATGNDNASLFVGTGTLGRRRSKISTASMMNLPTTSQLTVAQKKLSSQVPCPGGGGGGEGGGGAVIYRHKHSSVSMNASPAVTVRARLVGDGVSLVSSLGSVDSPVKCSIVLGGGGCGIAASREGSAFDELL